MVHIPKYRWPTIASMLFAPSILLILLVSLRVVSLVPSAQIILTTPPPLPNAERAPLQLSSDPYTTSASQHQTEVEPDSYSYGSTIVATFQVGRFRDGGSSNIGWATSTDAGTTWKNGFLPGTTKVVGGPYTRISDPSVTYDAAHQTWIINSLTVTGNSGNLVSPAVIVNLSTDGGLTWGKPIKVIDGGSTFYDKNWITCDNTVTSPFYGHCYVEWDDDDKGGLIEMSTSTDGGHSWGKAQTTANNAHGLGGQPLVQPGGTVIVPISGYDTDKMLAFTSNNGGKSWSSTVTVAKITGSALASAETDGSGKVYLVWADCSFETNCKQNITEGRDDRNTSTSEDSLVREDDLVMSTSTDGVTWSPVQRIPITPRGSGLAYAFPGLAVDKSTSGSSAHLALAFYYHTANCSPSCDYYVGFVASTNGGASWTQNIRLAGPMSSSWLPQGRNKVGDYISTSFCGGLAFPVFAIASEPGDDGHLNEAIYTVMGGLVVQG